MQMKYMLNNREEMLYIIEGRYELMIVIILEFEF